MGKWVARAAFAVAHTLASGVIALVGDDERRQLGGIRHALIRAFDAPSARLAHRRVFRRPRNCQSALHDDIAKGMRLPGLRRVDGP